VYFSNGSKKDYRKIRNRHSRLQGAFCAHETGISCPIWLLFLKSPFPQKNEEYRQFYRRGRITKESFERAFSRAGSRGVDPKTTTALSEATFPILAIDLCLTPEEAKERMFHDKVKRRAVTKKKGGDCGTYFNARSCSDTENPVPRTVRSTSRGNST
jgi:hypothetical protein